MDIFSFVATYIWPLAIGYAAWLHKEMADLRNKLNVMEVDVAKNYSPKTDVTALEAKLVTMLTRIDDKVTRLLENRHDG